MSIKSAILPICLLIALNSIAQSGAKMFSENTLIKPIAYALWFDENVPVIEVFEFQRTESASDYVILENGYADFNLKNAKDLLSVKDLRQPVSIDIIFTKQPLRKEDWITNYYALLADRLTALFEIDPSLNSNSISWRIILQTKGTSRSEATELFHGIRVTYRIQDLSTLKTLPAEPLSLAKIGAILCYQGLNNPTGNEEETFDTPTDTDVLYPESIWNREVGTITPPKRTKTNEPPCPKFTTRMEKPKRKLIDRIRGR